MSKYAVTFWKKGTTDDRIGAEVEADGPRLASMTENVCFRIIELSKGVA